MLVIHVISSSIGENPSKYCVAITMFFRTIPNSNGITILYALTIHDKSMSSQNRNRNRNSDIEFPVSCVQLNREHSHTIVLSILRLHTKPPTFCCI